MLQPFKDMVADMWSSVDSRKREYGSLNQWKQQREHERAGRSRRRAANRYKITKPDVARQNIISLPTKKDPQLTSVQRNVSQSWWDRVRSVFSSEQRDLKDMNNAFSNYRLPPTDESEGRRRRSTNPQRIARSEIFKKRMMEKIYDDKLLEQLRAAGSTKKQSFRSLDSPLSNADSDQVVLLQHRLRKLEQQLFQTRKELELANKKLVFSNEKSKLLESLLDEANVDNEYVKSRRRIINLQSSGDNQPQLRALSPSPQRPYPVHPLFTSSPIRAHNHNEEPEQNNTGAIDEFYTKYPSIPKTAVLYNKSENPPPPDTSESLSPVRVDYNKYSSPR